MPICRRSNPERALLLAGALLGAVPALAPAQAQAQAQEPGQQQTQSEPAPAPSGARAAIGAQGDAALERLKAAIAAQQQQDGRAAVIPPSLPALPETERRRAFDGLHRRAPAPAMEARARAALDKGHAGLAEQRAAMAGRLAQALGLEAPDAAALGGALPAGDPATTTGARVPVLFASSTMPLGTLRAYAAQLERAGGVLAFRGMPGGLTKVAPMARLTAQILRLDPGCEGPACAMRAVQVIVDPLVFRQHGVTRVPALTLIPGDPTQPYCERDEESPHGSHVVYGDAALSGLLEEYTRLGGGKEEVSDVQARLERR